MDHRVFITGATGYLGNAIATRYVRAGHTVFGLTRSTELADALAETGVRPILGSIDEPDSYLAELKNCDSVVHTAIDYSPEAARIDQRALESVQAAVEDGRVRRVLYMSGIWVLGDTHGAVADESAALAPAEINAWRAPHEEVVMDLQEHDGVAAVILRPGVVYGGARGTFGGWFREATEKRIVTYPGGDQHWPLVHVDDVAEAYALALEHAPSGVRYYIADDSRFTVRELAEAVARASGARAVSWAPDDVVETLGPLGKALLLDQQVTSAKARRELGWTPMHTSFVAEAEALYREWRTAREARVG
jgi:nucleoside-diphosphate-sugar epimerase